MDERERKREKKTILLYSCVLVFMRMTEFCDDNDVQNGKCMMVALPDKIDDYNNNKKLGKNYRFA